MSIFFQKSIEVCILLCYSDLESEGKIEKSLFHAQFFACKAETEKSGVLNNFLFGNEVSFIWRFIFSSWRVFRNVCSEMTKGWPTQTHIVMIFDEKYIGKTAGDTKIAEATQDSFCKRMFLHIDELNQNLFKEIVESYEKRFKDILENLLKKFEASVKADTEA